MPNVGPRNTHASLSEVHGSVPVPYHRSIFKRIFAISGPAFLVSVGYMDPGNWATDLAAGSTFEYRLLWVLLLSNLMAVLLQSFAARLGLVRGLDLAQACRAEYPWPVNLGLYALCEVAIAACDLAEVLGSAIALQLLFGLPLLWGVLLTAADTFALLFLTYLGIRSLEACVLGLISIVGGGMILEIFLANPDWGGVAGGFVPSLPGAGALYIALGMLGATVMPHNLYLHSSLVQTRDVGSDPKRKKQVIRLNNLDSVVALNMAFFVNAAILIVSAAVFYRAGHREIAEIQDAHRLLAPILGASIAPVAFAVALLAAGQSSTITGTLAGQIVMEGFLDFRLPPWLRRLITRLMAIAPAVWTILHYGEEGTGSLLILSQVILSLQLPFAIVPLIHFVSDRAKMGEFAVGKPLRILGWSAAALISGLNGWLAYSTMRAWVSQSPWAAGAAGAGAVLLGTLFLYLVFRPLARKMQARGKRLTIHAPEEDLAAAMASSRSDKPIERVAVALDFSGRDAHVLRGTLRFLGPGRPAFTLMHVVESAGARFLGKETGDLETLRDEERLEDYAAKLRELGFDVTTAVGHGKPVPELRRMIVECKPDLVVLGAHGHRFLKDLLLGATADQLRHEVDASVLVIK